MIPLMKVTGEVSSVVLHRCSCYHLTQLIGVLEKMKRIQENMHLSLSCLKIALTFFYSYNVIVKPKSVNSKQSLVMLLLFRPRMLFAFILIPCCRSSWIFSRIPYGTLTESGPKRTRSYQMVFLTTYILFQRSMTWRNVVCSLSIYC